MCDIEGQYSRTSGDATGNEALLEVPSAAVMMIIITITVYRSRSRSSCFVVGVHVCAFPDTVRSTLAKVRSCV